MAPPAAMAATAAEAMARAAPKKPWRYYYVMAFPLSNAPTSDKLTGMLDLTDAIERREEAYLHRMLDRDVPPDRDTRASPFARYTARALAWLSGITAVGALAALVCIYRLQVTSMGDDIDPRAITAAYAVATCVMAQNVAVAAALRFHSPLLLRACVVWLSLSIGSVVLLLDEVDTVTISQHYLTLALKRPRRSFSDAQAELVLNGGDAPSLWHRFFVDGPAWFLLWVERHCVTSIEIDESDEDSVVDQANFFTPLWKPKTRKCTQQCLATHTEIESILKTVLSVVVVVMVTQVVLSLLLLWIDPFDALESDVAASKSNQTTAARKRKRRRRSQTSGNETDAAFPLPFSFTGLVRLACYGLALMGGTLAVVSLTLLTSCSFVGPTESWSLVLAAVFGVLQLVVALCALMVWRQQFVKSVLVGGLALESYVTSSLTAFCASLPMTPAVDSASPTPFLQDAYDMIFQQTCQPMKHWRLHVCVLTSVSQTPHGVTHVGLRDSPTCQDELTALLRTSAQDSLTWLTWMMTAQVVVLVWLLLPSVKALLGNAVALLCCRSSNDSADTIMAVKDLQQQKQELAEARAKRWKHATLDLAHARQLYLSTMKRSDDASLATEAAAFDAEWAKMTGGNASSVPTHRVMFSHQFEAIVRTRVLSRLTVQCKMDANISVSRDGKLLLMRIFASDNLLMTTLCQSGPSYKLQFADAIDPGDAFWHDLRELKSDNKVLDAHSVYQKFKLLQLHGVITRKEAEIFPTESLARVSARVHALMRIHRSRCGALETSNRHAPFVEYLPQRQLQYVYKRYPNRLDTAATAQQRRAAVLRTIDWLRLTRQIVDAEFDLDGMQRHGLIHAFTALHSASRFDATSRSALVRSWVAFWRPEYLPGEFAPHQHWLLNHLGRLSPFRQPLQAVRDYFGECIAFYFAWLACYSQWLVVPAVATVVLLATRTLSVSSLVAFIGAENEETAFHLSTGALAFTLAVLVWGAAFAKGWERQSVWYRLEWGMDDNVEDEPMPDRANFRGVRRRNPVTQELEVYFPGRDRVRRQITSAVVVVVAGAVHLVVCLLLLLAQGVAAKWFGLLLAVLGSCAAIAMLVRWNGESISALAHRLSEWENYQNERDFQRGVILKVCALQLVNTFGPLLLMAFVLFHTTDAMLPPLLRDWATAFQERIAPHVGVVVELQVLLALIFVTRIASHLLLMVPGLLHESLSESVESELALPAYRGSYEDYTEIVVQLGLVAMFSSVFPVVSLFAFVECALELRLDALDLCLFLQRPAPEPANGIGPWSACVRGVLALAAIVNFALFYFVADNCADWSLVRRVGAFLANVVVVAVVAQVLWLLIPSQSRKVQDVRARHAFLIDRYFGDDDGGGDNSKATDHNTMRDMERQALDEPDVEDTDKTLSHHQERLALLRRLNTALRKHNETLEPEAVEATAPPMEREEKEQEEDEEEQAIVGYVVHRKVSSPPVSDAAVAADAPAPAPVTVTMPTERETLPVVVPPTEEPRYERTTLEGLAAVHVASERERFDFGQDTGWHHEQLPSDQTERRTSLSKRFSLFRKRRTSVDDSRSSTTAKPVPDERPVVQLSGLEAVHEAARRDQFDFSTDPWRPSGEATGPL